MKGNQGARREVEFMKEPIANRPVTSPARTARRSPWPWLILAILLAPLLAFAIFAVLAMGGVMQTWHSVSSMATGRPVIRTDQPAVITQIRQLNRLETASFTVEKVIEGGQSHGNAVLDALLGDRLLFIAHGEVIAGVDFSQLGEGDVVVHPDGSGVSLRLPPARILEHVLDNERSRVYDRRVGILTKGDANLESQVRQTAEQEILNAACEGGILDQANSSAQMQVRALLQTLGVRQVDFLPSGTVTDTGCGGV
jgi:hypothetical protein